MSRVFPKRPSLKMIYDFLLIVQGVIAALLVAVILVQKSEGGGLTSGGSPTGLMSARGTADFLTRSTAVLASLFVLMSIVLAVMAATNHANSIDTSLAHKPAPVPTSAPAPTAPAPAAPTSDSPVPIAN